MRPSKRRGWLRRSFRSVRPTRGFTVPDTLDRLDNLPRLSQTRTMCSLIHNDAASMTGYPRVDLLPRGPATQMHRATFSARLPACSAAARATDRPGQAPNNRDRDQTQITFSATFSKRYRYAFFSSSPLNVRRGPLTHPLFFSLPPPPASTTRSRAASPVVVMAGRSVRCRSRLHHRQRARPRRRCVYRESSWGHPGCKGKERGRRILRIGWRAEGRGSSKTPTSCSP
jgi:hypothetical protein